jgi:hypothetical protein
VQPYLDVAVAQRLAAFCAARGVTESGVVQAALVEYLDGTGDRTLLFRRLDRLGRANERTQRSVEVLSEAFGTWVKIWFAHTPQIPEDAKGPARCSAQARFKQFVTHVFEQFSGGKRFLDDLPHEDVADEEELASAARTTETRQ